MPVSISELEVLNRTELIKAWEAIFGSSPPPSTSQDLMRLILGWEVQAKHARPQARALKTAVKKLLKLKTHSAGKGQTSSLGSSATAVIVKPSLSAGTRLSRDWQGKTYTVDVLDKGFAYDGKLFTSLSPIAKAITGSHRSGPHFFGVSK